MNTGLTSNCMMLRQTPQMLEKSGIKKGDAMNYLAFIVRIVESSMFVLKNRVLKSDVTQLAGKRRSLRSLWSVE